MVVGFFLHSLIPLRTEDDLRREVFALAYGSGGAFSVEAIEGMGRGDRDAYIDLLIEQKKAEEAEAKKKPKTRR